MAIIDLIVNWFTQHKHDQIPNIILEDELLRLQNNLRADYKKQPLDYCHTLHQPAHAIFQTIYTATSHSDSVVLKAVQEHKYQPSLIGINLYYGNMEPMAIIAKWQQKQASKRNMLLTDYTHWNCVYTDDLLVSIYGCEGATDDPLVFWS